MDEAGCTGLLPADDSDVQPVFLQAAVFLPESQLSAVTSEYLAIKRRFFPNLISGEHRLDAVLTEIKGSRLRRHVRGRHRERRQAIGFLDKVLDSLARHDGQFVARVWIKGVGVENKPRSLYTFSLQKLHQHFQHFLGSRGEQGFFIADSRFKQENSNATHSIFTQKFSALGDPLYRIIETPTFGHSENHVGLQLADHICSALLYPIAVYVYCSGLISSVHLDPRYRELRDRYGPKLRRIAYTYKAFCERSRRDRTRGGVTVSDSLGQKPSHFVFGRRAPATGPCPDRRGAGC